RVPLLDVRQSLNQHVLGQWPLDLDSLRREERLRCIEGGEQRFAGIKRAPDGLDTWRGISCICGCTVTAGHRPAPVRMANCRGDPAPRVRLPARPGAMDAPTLGATTALGNGS